MNNTNEPKRVRPLSMGAALATAVLSAASPDLLAQTADVESDISSWVERLSGGASRVEVPPTFPEILAVIRSAVTGVASNNLAATSLEVDSADPRIGYPLAVSVTIDARQPTRNVSVTFFAIDKDRANVRQLPLGATTVDFVSPGRSTYELVLDVPTSLETAGPYYVGALLDAADVITESNEDDNEVSAVVDFSPARSPNLFIEDMEADRNAIVLDRRAYDYDKQAGLGVVNSDAGGTVSWGVKGARTPIDVEAFAVLRLSRSDGGARSHDVPLYLWNSEAGRYMNAYGVDPVMGDTGVVEWLPIGPVGELLAESAEGREDVPVTEFDRRSAHLDFYFPGLLAEELEIALRKLNVLFGPLEPPPDLSEADIRALRDFLFNIEPELLSSALCVSIRPADPAIVEDTTDDNEVCTPLALVLPGLPPTPPPPVLPPVPPIYPNPGTPILFDELYETRWGGKNFGFGVSFSASASADNRGFIVTGQGSVPVTAFGLGFEFMKLEGRAQVLPLSDRDNPPPDQSPGFTLELSHLGFPLSFITVPSGSLGPLQIFFSKDYPPEDKPKPPKIVLIGPVPVKLEAGVTGNIGAEYSIEFGAEAGNGLAYSTGPFANIEAGVAASVTVGVADVGVEGVLTLVQEKFDIIASATINVHDERHTDGTSEIVIVPRLRAVNEITGPQGAINAFISVEVPTVKRCSWGFVKGFCPGLATIKYPYNLETWQSFAKRDTLLDEQAIIDIITFPDGSVSYFK